MLSIHEHETVEEASTHLLGFILRPFNWVALDTLQQPPLLPPGQNASYQRRVGKLRICAYVDITPNLDVLLRVAFRAPGLTPMRAADHLETFLRGHLTLIPNSEWQVEIDERHWIHFMRPYTRGKLKA